MDQAEEIIRELIEYGCREFDNNGPDYCRYCLGEEFGWVENSSWRNEFDHRIVHKEGCIYQKAFAYLGAIDSEAYRK
jgi:hypothetical protein